MIASQLIEGSGAPIGFAVAVAVAVIAVIAVWLNRSEAHHG